MRVVEIFYSLQGEGFLAGNPGIFIRLAGCPLRCKWCDTKYAWDFNTGTEKSLQQLLDETRKWQADYVVITGGEPMLSDQITDLTQLLKQNNKHITIETAGIQFVPDLACDLMSISPKFPSSQQQPGIKCLHPEVIFRLIDAYDYQLKFVVESPGDIEDIQRALRELPNVDTSRVMLMPQAVNKKQLLERVDMVADLCLEHGFTLSPRLQALLWNSAPGR